MGVDGDASPWAPGKGLGWWLLLQIEKAQGSSLSKGREVGFLAKVPWPVNVEARVS